jgi:hypothetical protein
MATNKGTHLFFSTRRDLGHVGEAVPRAAVPARQVSMVISSPLHGRSNSRDSHLRSPQNAGPGMQGVDSGDGQIGTMDHDVYIPYRAVDFGDGVTGFTASVATLSITALIEGGPARTPSW